MTQQSIDLFIIGGGSGGVRAARIAGVVEHGLFIGLARAVVLAGAGGVRVVER